MNLPEDAKLTKLINKLKPIEQEICILKTREQAVVEKVQLTITQENRHIRAERAVEYLEEAESCIDGLIDELTSAREV